jgi:hypothetical protein
MEPLLIAEIVHLIHAEIDNTLLLMVFAMTAHNTKFQTYHHNLEINVLDQHAHKLQSSPEMVYANNVK